MRTVQKGGGNHRDEDGTKEGIKDEVADEEERRCQFLQRVLLDWLAVNAESDAALLHARHFYIGQWSVAARSGTGES